MLTNNYSVLNSSPGRAIGGFTNLYSNYKPSSWYSFFAIDTLETASPVKRASLPSGTQPPYSWILAMKGGELSSTTGITGTGSMAPTMYISRDLASTMGGVGSISGSLSLLSQLSAALAGVGALQGSLSLGLSLSSNLSGTGALTPSLSLLVGMVASIGGSGAITANLTGIARLEASIFVNSGTASVQELVEGVWSAVAADNDTAGTMGEKLNDAGSAGNPWTDTTTYGAGTKGKLLQDAADDADTAANK